MGIESNKNPKKITDKNYFQYSLFIALIILGIIGLFGFYILGGIGLIIVGLHKLISKIFKGSEKYKRNC